MPLKKDSNDKDPISKISFLKEKAKVAFHTRQYKKSIDCYTKALAICPIDDINELAILYSNRSAAYHHERCFEASLKDANNVVRLRPSWSKGYFRRGNAEFSCNKLEESLVSFGKSLTLHEEQEPDIHDPIRHTDPHHISSSQLIQSRLYDTSLALEERDDDLYFRALLPGRDICLGSFYPVTKIIHEIAKQMKNLVYLIGDRRTNQCIVIDLCWDIEGIIQAAQKDGMVIVAAFITHYHVDHAGGRPPPPFQGYGIQVPGIKKFMSQYPKIPVFMHPDDIPYLKQQDPDMPIDKLRHTHDDQEMFIGGTRISLKIIHTPGHTKGSQCLLIQKSRLITGDTLFVHACGRTDLPGGDLHELYESLQEKLCKLPDATFVYPGHAYNSERSTIGDEKENGLLKKMSYEEFVHKIHHLSQ